GGAQTWSDAGTLTIASAVANGTYVLTLSGTSTTSSISGIISGTGGLTKSGDGTWTLSGANTYTGTTTLSAGTLALGNSSALGSTGDVTFTGGTLRFAAGITPDISSRIKNSTSAISVDTNYNLNGDAVTFGSALAASNTGGLTKSGTGTLFLSGVNAYTGTTTINGGIVRINTSSSLGGSTSIILSNNGQLQYFTTGDLNLGASRTITLSGNGSVRNSSGSYLLTFGGAVDTGVSQFTVTGVGDSLYSGVIGGSGSLYKSNAGTVTLSAANTYTGTTTVFQGSLNIQHNTALGTTAGGTSVTSGAALQIQGGITVGDEALTLNGTGIASDGALRNISGTNTYGGLVTLGSATRINSDADTLSLSNVGTITGSGYGLTVGGAGNTSIASIIGTVAGALTKDGAGTLTLTGANTYTGATTVSAGVLNIRNATALGTTANGTSVTSGAALQIQGGITVGAEALTLNGTGISSDGALRNISGTNTYGGLLTLGSATRINSDADSLTLSNAGTILGSGYGLTVGGAGNTSIASIIGTGAGTVTKDGAGTLTLTGTNTYTGATTVNAGTLKAGASAAVFGNGSAVTVNATTGGTTATLDLDGNSVTIGSLTFGGSTGTSTSTSNVQTGAGTLTLGGNVTYDATNNPNGSTLSGKLALGATRTFTIGDSSNAAADLTVSAIISGSTFGVTKAGAGTLLLSGANTYTGATTVNLGTLKAGASATVFGSGSAVTVNATTASSTATLDLDGYDVTIGSLTFGGSGGTSTSTNTVQMGAGKLTLGGNVTYDATNNPLGATLSGKLELGADRTFTIGNSSNAAADLTVSAVISDGFGLTKAGSGTLVLSGANTYTGTTTVSAGVLNIQDNTALGTTAGGTSVTSGAALQIQGGITVGAEALTLNGTGVSSDGALRNISGANTYGGLLTLGSATRINSDADTLTLSNAGTITGSGFDLTVGGAGNTSIASIIGTGAGTLTKDGAGTLTLTGANTYTGATTVSAGVLNIRNATALGTTANGTSVTSGAALQIQGGITVGDEALTLNGTGIASDGALRNISGTNTYGGLLTLGSATRINSDADTLTLSNAGTITGSGYGLTVGGAGNTSIASIIGTVAGTLTKDGAGTLQLSGSDANTFTGATTINNGTLLLNKTASVNAVGSSAITVGDGVGAASSAVLQLGASNQFSTTAAVTLAADGKFALAGFNQAIGTIGGAGLIDLSTANSVLTLGGNNASSTFGGSILGGGQLVKEGTGTLTFSSAVSFIGDLTLAGGTLRLNNNVTVDTLHITGSSVLDFDSGAWTLRANHLIIDSTLILSISNWVEYRSFFIVENSFTSGSNTVLFNVAGEDPQNQIVFAGFSGDATQWRQYNLEITPVPEPSTYGAIFVGLTTGLVLWRRRKQFGWGRPRDLMQIGQVEHGWRR
ncbi:MAG: hypothetical protein RIQ93_894, partial [Verrucomicrobiota bacterium]